MAPTGLSAGGCSIKQVHLSDDDPMIEQSCPDASEPLGYRQSGFQHSCTLEQVLNTLQPVGWGIGPERQCACRPQEGLRPAQPTGERAGIFRPARLEKIEGRADRGCAWGVSGLGVAGVGGRDGYNLSHRKKRHFQSRLSHAL